MSELLKIVLSLSISGTLLFFILLSLKPLYKNKLSKRWQYYVWLIVVVRMLIPFTPETTLVGSVFSYLDNINMETIQTAPPTNDTQSDLGSNDNYITPNAEPQAPQSKMDTTPSLSMQAIFSKVYENLWVLWAAIAFALMIRKITMYQSFVRFVKAGRTEVSDIEILNILADIGDTVGVKRPVELYTNPLISSPMLLGFFHPYIMLPNIELDSTKLAYIMRHELTHYKRLDMFYKWFVQITVCLHWFNPFAYLMAKEINKCCELSCDESIIRTMDKDEKKSYGDTLLNSIKEMGNYNDKLATITLTEGAEQLKERLDAIMKFKKKNKAVVAITIMLTVMLGIGATAVGAYAMPNTHETKANPITPNATPISSNTYSHNFSNSSFQSGYYQDSFVIELQWNIQDKAAVDFKTKETVTLKDGGSVSVSFNDGYTRFASDKDALAAIKNLIERLNAEKKSKYAPEHISMPLVVSIEKVPLSELNQFVKKSYSERTINKFAAVFASLDNNIKNHYYTKSYQDNRIDFFSVAIDSMDKEQIKIYAEKALKDPRVDFYAVLSDELNPNEISKHAEIAYAANNIALFSIIADNLTSEQIKIYAEKALKDQRVDFYAVLSDELNPNEISKHAEIAYVANNIALFSIIADNLTSEQIKIYAEKALKDQRVDFYAVLSDELNPNEISKHAEIAYAAPAPTNSQNSFWGDDWENDWDDFSNVKWNDDWGNFSNVNGTSIDTSKIKLINTKQWKLSGITKIEMAYTSDEVKLIPSQTKEIILKEYLTEDSPSYYAKTSITDSILKIEGGERPAPSPTGYMSSIEIYVPATFSGEIELETKSGSILVTDYKGKLNCTTGSGRIIISDSKIDDTLKTGSGIIEGTRTGMVTEKGKLDCTAGSGLIIFKDSALRGTFSAGSGQIDLDITNLLGDIDAHVKSGSVIVNILSSASFSVKASAGTGEVINNFSDSFSTSNKSVTGKWGTNPKDKINLTSDSGDVEIAKK